MFGNDDTVVWLFWAGCVVVHFLVLKVFPKLEPRRVSWVEVLYSLIVVAFLPIWGLFGSISKAPFESEKLLPYSAVGVVLALIFARCFFVVANFAIQLIRNRGSEQ